MCPNPNKEIMKNTAISNGNKAFHFTQQKRFQIVSKKKLYKKLIHIIRWFSVVVCRAGFNFFTKFDFYVLKFQKGHHRYKTKTCFRLRNNEGGTQLVSEKNCKKDFMISLSHSLIPSHTTHSIRDTIEIALYKCSTTYIDEDVSMILTFDQCDQMAKLF